MTKSTKKIVTIILIVAICFILVAGIIACVLLVPLQGKKNKYEWNSSNAFDESKDAFTITNEIDTDFNILQLTDMQLWMGGKDNKWTFEMCERLIRAEEPDLVVLSGDNVSGITSPYLLKDVIEFYDELAEELDFYWAPIFGNHDNEIKATPLWSADQYVKSNEKNGRCLFKKGPANLGVDDVELVGNYVINVKEDNKIIQSVYLMDTSSYIDNSESDINAKKAVYNDSKFNVLTEDEKRSISGTGSEMYVTDSQFEWFKWNAENIKSLNNGVEVPALSFTHFALNGVDKAYDELYVNAKNKDYVGENAFKFADDTSGYNEKVTYANLPQGGLGETTSMTFNANEETDTIKGFGSYQYKPGIAVKNTQFTTKAKEFGLYGSFFGHDHENDGVLIYDNIIYGYGLKAGPAPKPWNGSRYFGGTVLIIKSNVPKQLEVEHSIDKMALDYWNKK